MGKNRSHKGENMSSAELAKLLRTSEEVVLDLEEKMDGISGKKGVIDGIIKENKEKTNRQLKEIGLNESSSSEEVYQGLIKKTRETDQILFKYFNSPNFSKKEDYQKILETIKDLVGNLNGFYLKEEKARELFRKNPPQRIMESLGYTDINQMLEKEDIFELFSALRIVEESDWMNKVFFVPFKDLTKDDFEERDLRVMVLPERWSEIGRKFLGQKLHHMSHLKEMGIVFVIPIKETNLGEMVYLFFMTLHYIYEVEWYSRLFKSYSSQPDFTHKMTEALKVGTGSEILPNKGKVSWRITSGYLAKKDINDPRLFEPHISPESWHYSRTAKIIAQFSKENSDLNLNFWVNSDTSARIIENKLVSFDLFDNGVALLGKKKLGERYFYHQQDALWNKIFIKYLGEEKLDQVLMENLNKGFVTL